MKTTIKTCLLAVILVACAPLAMADTATVTTNGPSQLDIDWVSATDYTNLPMSFFEDHDGQVWCSDTTGTQTCQLFEEYAEVYSSYNSFWNSLVATRFDYNFGMWRWPFYESVAQYGGQATYSLPSYAAKNLKIKHAFAAKKKSGLLATRSRLAVHHLNLN